MSLSKSFKKDDVKNIAKILIIESSIAFTDFTEYNEFENMSLDFKYNKMKKFSNLLTIFKNLKPKNPKNHLKKE